jgi:hypothetical protein
LNRAKKKVAPLGNTEQVHPKSSSQRIIQFTPLFTVVAEKLETRLL